MAGSTYFVQECPTCGRNLQIRLEYLGKRVVCQHCGARFEAYDRSTGGAPVYESNISNLERADELIEAASRSGIGTGSKA